MIFTPIFKLNKGKVSVFGIFNGKKNYFLPAIVYKFGGGGSGVGHAQRIVKKRFHRKNFLHKKHLFFRDFVKIFVDKSELL